MLEGETSHNRRAIAVSLGILAFCAVFALLYFARTLFIPIVLAAVTALVLAPLVRRLRSFGLPRSLASALLVAIGGLACAAVLERIAQPASEWLARLPEGLAKARFAFRHLMGFIRDVQEATKDVADLSQGGGGEKGDQVVVQGPGLTEIFLANTGQFLFMGGITLILLYFLLANGDLFLRKTVYLLPKRRDKRRTVEIARDVQQVVSHYLLTVTAINIGLGVVTAAAMMLLGVPDAVLWGVMAGLLNFIPYLGAMLTATAIFLASLITFSYGALFEVLAPPLVFYALTILEGQFITPSVVGRRLRLNPVVVFVFMLAWGWMWGIAGVLLAVPLLVVFKIFCDHSESLSVVGQYLSLEPAGEELAAEKTTAKRPE